MAWGIADTASQIEKIRAGSSDYLGGLNSVGEIEYTTYSELRDFYHDLLGEAYEQGLKDAPNNKRKDAEPVKHGHWTSSQGLAEVGEVQCSNCKTIYYADDLYNVGETDENGSGQALMPNCCPHCGAKMDEVEKDG